MPFPVEIALFSVCLSAAALLFAFWVLYAPVKRFFYKHRTVRAYYKKVYQVALDGDYYLINDFSNKTAGEEEFHVDHILIGNKFIYCIRDRYYDGAVVATQHNKAWIFYKKQKATYVPNPLLKNRVRVERLSLMGDTDPRIFVSVVLINDDCFITPFETDGSNQEYVVSLRQLPRLIRDLESDPDVPLLDETQIAVAARDYAELNLSGKRK